MLCASVAKASAAWPRSWMPHQKGLSRREITQSAHGVRLGGRRERHVHLHPLQLPSTHTFLMNKENIDHFCKNQTKPKKSTNSWKHIHTCLHVFRERSTKAHRIVTRNYLQRVGLAEGNEVEFYFQFIQLCPVLIFFPLSIVCIVILKTWFA